MQRLVLKMMMVMMMVTAGLGLGITAALANDLARSQSLKDQGQPLRSSQWMIAAANPYAAQAGADILAKGGSAADAMVAVQTVLGLVEPQSSGIGGGAFLVWFDAETGALTTLDGRETASRHVTESLFLDEMGEPLKFYDAVVGGRSVGAPGTPALMIEAHRRWGKLKWSSLFNRGIDLADHGFTVSPRLAFLVARDESRLKRFEATARYFFPPSSSHPQGQAIAAGQILKNPAYAETLRGMAADQGASFYHGAIAQDIAATVQSAKGNPGRLDAQDMAAYTIIERPPVCAPYRGFEVCGMGPPSSGGLTVGQILGMVEHYDLPALGPDSAEAWRLIGDASRLAFADRGRYMADSDYVPVPVKGLLDHAYLKARADLLMRGDALPQAMPGTPPRLDQTAQIWGDDESLEMPSTSHISIVDQWGNALSMTTTIENAFGSRLMTKGGFLLNNEMTDFSFRAEKDGAPIANRVEPGKGPRSSMAPTIVMKGGKPHLVIGSPGGSRIIGYVAQAIIAYVDWGMDAQQAVAMPHLVNRFGVFEIEQGTAAEALADALTAKGFEVKLRGLNSGLHAIAVTPDGGNRGGDRGVDGGFEGGLEGGADPRREGLVLGR